MLVQLSLLVSLAGCTAHTASAPTPSTIVLPGPLPAFVAAVDVDPDAQRVGVLVGSSDTTVRALVLDRTGKVVFQRSALVAPAGALALGRTTLAVAGPDDAHAPGAALRLYAFKTAAPKDAGADRDAAPTRRVPLGDVAVQAVELSDDERLVAVATTGLVDGRGALALVEGTTTRTVPLPFRPSALVFFPAGHVTVGGSGGMATVALATGAIHVTPGPAISALAVVDGALRTDGTATALGPSGALTCLEGAPAWLPTPQSSTTTAAPIPVGAVPKDPLPCARFAGGPALVAARHGITEPPTVLVWWP